MVFHRIHSLLICPLCWKDVKKWILSWAEKRVISWSQKGLLGHKVCKKRIEVDKAKVDLISNFPFLSLWSKVDLSLAMLVSISDLLRILVEELHHLLTSLLNILLLCLMNLVWKLWKSFILYWCNLYCAAPWFFFSIWDYVWCIWFCYWGYFRSKGEQNALCHLLC